MVNSPTSEKVVLITGASSGFGKITSELLAQRGDYWVFGTSRNPAKVSDIPRKVEILELNVDSDDSAHLCVEKVLERAGRIDVLVNNAGFVLFGAVEEASIEEAKSQLETNFFGAMRMTKEVLPAMRREKSGQIINISSMAGQVGLPFLGYYAASKFGLEGFTEALRYETKNLGIKVSLVEPGFFKTNIGATVRQTSTRIDEYATMRRNVGNEIVKHNLNGEDPKIVAETVINVIESEKPKLRYTVGREKMGLFFKKLVPEAMFEGQVRKMFKIES